MEKEKSENQLFIKQLINVTILAFALAFIVTRIVLPTKIIGASMEPTLDDGSYVLVNKLDKRLDKGDIVILHHGILDGEYLVKRVIAIENDYLEITEGKVYINGVKIEEPYVKEEWYHGSYSGVIPEAHIFVMGDNRNRSIDSRSFGLVKLENATGKVLFK